MWNKYPFKYSESLLSTLHCINLELSTWHGLRMTKRELIVFGGQFSSSTRLSILLCMKQLNDQRWNKYNQRRMWLCRREDRFQDSSKPSEMGLRNVDCDGCCWLLGGWRAGDRRSRSLIEWAMMDGDVVLLPHCPLPRDCSCWTSNTSSSVLVIVIVCYCASTHGIGANFR